MSVTSRKPLRMAGANVNSGSVNTGEQNMTDGGGQLVCLSGMLSGNPDGGLVIISGTAGRLNSVSLHTYVSGVAITFFDATATFTSGGPFLLSGHKIIYSAPANTLGLQYAVIKPGVPFTSGLQVRAASGAPGFSIGWSPQTDPAVG